jgi:hypothetical protein
MNRRDFTRALLASAAVPLMPTCPCHGTHRCCDTNRCDVMGQPPDSHARHMHTKDVVERVVG